MLLCVTFGSITPGVQVESGNPLTDLQLPAERCSGRLGAVTRAVAVGPGSGGAGGFVVATRLVQPVLRKTIAKVTTTVLDSGFMVDSITRGPKREGARAPTSPRYSPETGFHHDISPDHLH